MDVARARIFVSGQVQGVFYRASAAEQAEELELAGFVRNLRDGRVEGVFQGERDAVERMIAWCKTGPPMAMVTRVEVGWEDPDPNERRFGERRT
jgi:acylphosphatase